jgi:predicted alpha/beta hydrolase family esterase
MASKTNSTPSPRLLVVPGLNDSGPVHWQTWLQSLHRHALRVEQRDWLTPDLDRWARQVGLTMESAGPSSAWLVAAHSFGSLAVARLLALWPDAPIVGALLVAPADPSKFGVSGLLPHTGLPCATTVVASETDPWMRADQARLWARCWGSHWVNLGDAGHINAEAGFGPWPFAQRWVAGSVQRSQRALRLDRADIAEWSFAV